MVTNPIPIIIIMNTNHIQTALMSFMILRMIAQQGVLRLMNYND